MPEHGDRRPAGVPLGMGPEIDRPSGPDDLGMGPPRGTPATHRRSDDGKRRATATTADQRPQGQDWRSSTASSHARCESMSAVSRPVGGTGTVSRPVGGTGTVSRPVGGTGRLYETRKNLERPAIEPDQVMCRMIQTAPSQEDGMEVSIFEDLPIVPLGQVIQEKGWGERAVNLPPFGKGST